MNNNYFSISKLIIVEKDEIILIINKIQLAKNFHKYFTKFFELKKSN